jgi:murein DD-endopeptidase MepM/ murein hydrolase activator NlpD
MEDVIDRDNNFYRVMMQADPINNAQRYAGLERQRLYGILDSMPDADLLKSVTSKLDRLDRQIYSQIKSFDQLKELVGKNKDRLAHIPAIQPISEVNLKQMASGYGYRRDPIYGVSRFHEGMDFAADTGTPVYATGDGRVAEAGWKSGYGNAIDINHGYNYVTRYAHLSQILVKPGQEVKRGDLIGKVGNTGKSTGSHLHYEVRFNGEAQNPIDYYYYDLTPEQYDQMIRMANNAGHVMD